MFPLAHWILDNLGIKIRQPSEQSVVVGPVHSLHQIPKPNRNPDIRFGWSLGRKFQHFTLMIAYPCVMNRNETDRSKTLAVDVTIRVVENQVGGVVETPVGLTFQFGQVSIRSLGKDPSCVNEEILHRPILVLVIQSESPAVNGHITHELDHSRLIGRL